MLCGREFTNGDASASFLIFKDGLIELAHAFFVSGAKSGNPVLRLNFFDIEAQTLDTCGLEKVVDLLGVTKGLAGNHGDDVEGDAVVLQQLQTAHGQAVAAVAPPGLAVQIVKKIGTVDTKAHTNVMAPDKVAPCLVQQGAVGLNGMNDVRPTRSG